MQLSLAQFRLRSQSPGVHLNAIALHPEDFSNYIVFSPEITMPKINLSAMTVEALMDLRKRVDEMLREHRAEIQKQIERMDRAIAVVGVIRAVRGDGSSNEAYQLTDEPNSSSNIAIISSHSSTVIMINSIHSLLV